MNHKDSIVLKYFIRLNFPQSFDFSLRNTIVKFRMRLSFKNTLPTSCVHLNIEIALYNLIYNCSTIFPIN